MAVTLKHRQHICNSASEIPCVADCMSNYFVAIGEEVKK